MFKIIEYLFIGFILGFILAVIIKKLITIEGIKKYIPIFLEGLLDRFDGLLLAAPVVYAYLYLILY